MLSKVINSHESRFDEDELFELPSENPMNDVKKMKEREDLENSKSQLFYFMK